MQFNTNDLPEQLEKEIIKLLPSMNEKTRKILRWSAVAAGIIAVIIFFVLNKAKNDKRSKSNIDVDADGDEQNAGEADTIPGKA